MRSEALRLALALAPPLGVAALLPPLADKGYAYWALSLPFLLWLRAAAWIGGREARMSFFYLGMGLPLRAWAWSALGAAAWSDLCFLILADLASCVLATLLPSALGLGAAGIAGLLVSLLALLGASAALAAVDPAGAAAILVLAAGFAAWLSVRRRP